MCLPQAVRGPRLGRDVIGLCAPCGWFTAADLDGTPLAQACVAREERGCGLCGEKACLEGDALGATGSWDGCNRAVWRFGAASLPALLAAPESSGADKDEM